MRSRSGGGGRGAGGWFAILSLALAAAAPEEPGSGAEGPEARAIRGLWEASRASIVRVEFHFKENPEALDPEDPYDMARPEPQYAENRYALYASGVVVDGKGGVLVGDFDLDDRLLGKVVVVGADGKAREAARERILARSPAQLVRAKDAAGLVPLAFAEAPADPGMTLYGLAVYEDEDRWHSMGFQFLPLFGDPGRTEPAFFGTGMLDSWTRQAFKVPPLVLVGDGTGRPAGCQFSFRLDARQESSVWRAKDVLGDPGISLPDLDAVRERLARACREVFAKVTVNFRLTGKDEELQLRSEDGDDWKKLEAYGLAVGKRRVFVPRTLDRQMAAKIDTIEVEPDGRKPLPARFLCAYKTFWGFVVETDEDLPRVASLTGPGDLLRTEPFFGVAAKEKFGGKTVFAEPNRAVGRTRGYGNRFDWETLRILRSGAFLYRPDGALLGVYLKHRKEDEERREIEGGGGGRFFFHRGRGRGGPEVSDERVFPVSEIRKMLEDPPAFRDEQIVARSKEEERQRVWMGIEFAAMNKDLAKALEIEKPTKDGALGLIVYHVYPGSPAAEMGLQEEDILLKIQEKGKGTPIELKSENVPEDREVDFSALEGEEAGMEVDPDETLWPTRDNFLTKLIETIGEGKTVEVTCLSGGREVRKETEIRRSPPDFESAKKYQNKEVGLTVKEITYEVAWYLNTEPGRGVIVSKVEPGSPAAVARIHAFDIVTAVDGTAVQSPDQLRIALDTAIRGKRDALKLTLVFLGKSRFADLKLGKPGPPPDRDGREP